MSWIILRRKRTQQQTEHKARLHRVQCLKLQQTLSLNYSSIRNESMWLTASWMHFLRLIKIIDWRLYLIQTMNFMTQILIASRLLQQGGRLTVLPQPSRLPSAAVNEYFMKGLALEKKYYENINRFVSTAIWYSMFCFFAAELKPLASLSSSESSRFFNTGISVTVCTKLICDKCHRWESFPGR